MTDYDVVWKVAKLFKTTYIGVIKRKKWKTSYRIALKGTKAITLMTALRPLMGSRRKRQIDAAIRSAGNRYD